MNFVCVCVRALYLGEKSMLSQAYFVVAQHDSKKRGEKRKIMIANPSIREFLHVTNKEICTGCLDYAQLV